MHGFVISDVSRPGTAPGSIRTFHNQNSPACFRQRDRGSEPIRPGPNYYGVESISSHVDAYFTCLGVSRSARAVSRRMHSRLRGWIAPSVK
jgi:alanine racemase